MIHTSEKKLLERAKVILALNRRGTFTIPTSELYPFQWNWDSGFHSLGYIQYDPEFAMIEFESLLSGQWKNGMIPHILFHSEKEKSYFPNYDYWNANVNSGAPSRVKTSGITQPPVLGFVLEKLLTTYPDNEKILTFVAKMFPLVVNYHQFWYTYRDPNNEGLVCIYHPWESGRDNSPLWDESMNRIQVDKSVLPAYTRRDTAITDPSERPTSDQYDKYLYLLELGKSHQYDGPEIMVESPFLIQDTLINSLLIRSNEGLIRIGEVFDFDVNELQSWQEKSINAFNTKMWNEKLAFYCGYDLHQDKQLACREVGGMVPLFAGIPNQEKALELNKYLINLNQRNYYLCPSFDVDSPYFESKRYWRGPIWAPLNWLIYRGLNRYGYTATASQVKADLMELVSNRGFYEYFECQRAVASSCSNGYGGNNFSWTAALLVDLIVDA